MEAEFTDTTVFSSYEEVKATVGQKKVLKVFLVDQHGKKHLAVVGEDFGDAHYHYCSSKPFSKYGVLDCHNRKELIVWLERVISESGGAPGAHLMADENNPDGVYFTDHTFERAHYPDGRRCSRWYLVDQHGDRHLAVIGIERDTKDGHYNYIAEEPFASIKGLHCSNQSGVYKWLESMLTHHPGDAEHSTQSRGSGAAGGDRPRPLVINLSALRSARMSAAALKSLEEATIVDGVQRAKPKERKSSGAPPQPLKQKTVGIVQQVQLKKAKKMQEDIIAEEQKLQHNHLAKLKRAAAAEVAADTAAKACTLGWLHSSLVGEDAEHLDHWMGLLNAVLDLQQEQVQEQHDGTAAAGQQGQAAGAASSAAPDESADVMKWIRQPDNFKHHLRILLECLKEMGASDLPARLLITHKVIPVVQRCLSYPHTAVVSMAQHMLDRWRWQLAGHMHVLTCPTYMEDHLAAVEEEIANGLVPLPQLPKHKQALLNSAMAKPPIPPGFQTPAPLPKPGSQQQQQPQFPASAPAALNPATSAGLNTAPGQQGIAIGFTPMPASTGFGLTPGVQAGTGLLQTPGFYTPVGLEGGLGLGAGMPGVLADGAAGGIRGTGAKLPGFVGATTGPRGGLVFNNAMAGAGSALASTARPPLTMTNALGMNGVPAGLVYNQQGVNTGMVDPTAAGYGSGGLAGWGTANGLYGSAGQLPQQISGDSTGAAAAGPASGSSMDFSGLQQQDGSADQAAAAAGVQQAAQQQQQLALQLQYQQQLRAQMILMSQQQAAAAAGAGGAQYAGALQQQQSVQPGAAAPVGGISAISPGSQPQQQWLMWQQPQSQMMWAASPGQLAAAQPTQSTGSQGVSQQ